MRDMTILKDGHFFHNFQKNLKIEMLYFRIILLAKDDFPESFSVPSSEKMVVVAPLVLCEA